MRIAQVVEDENQLSDAYDRLMDKLHKISPQMSTTG